MLIYCDHPTVRATVPANNSTVNNHNLLFETKSRARRDDNDFSVAPPNIGQHSGFVEEIRLPAPASRFLVLTLQI